LDSEGEATQCSSGNVDLKEKREERGGSAEGKDISDRTKRGKRKSRVYGRKSSSGEKNRSHAKKKRFGTVRAGGPEVSGLVKIISIGDLKKREKTHAQ